MTCICTCMQQARLLLLSLSAQKPLCPSIHPFLLPNSSPRQLASGSFCQSSGRIMWYGGSVCELRSFWLLRLVTGHAASLAHRQPLMLQEAFTIIPLQCARGLHLGQVSRAVNDQNIIFRSLNNLFMMNESRNAQYFLSILHFPIFLTHN